MAGDDKPVGPATLATPDDPALTDPFPGIQATLDGIRDELRGVSTDGPSIFDLSTPTAITASQHAWQRLRVATVVLSASAAGTATLTIGSRTITFNLGVGVSVIPLPLTIERGNDISLAGAAAGLAGYLIATPE